MTDELSKAVDQLRKKDTALQKEIDELHERAKKLQGERKPIQAALSALDGSKNRKRKGKPGTTKKVVEDAIAEELKLHGGPLQDEDLRAAVEQRILDSGFSPYGFALRYREALASPLFSTDDNGIHLTNSQTNSDK